jgi:hypothetical protein
MVFTRKITNGKLAYKAIDDASCEFQSEPQQPKYFWNLKVENLEHIVTTKHGFVFFCSNSNQSLFKQSDSMQYATAAITIESDTNVYFASRKSVAHFVTSTSTVTNDTTTSNLPTTNTITTYQ